MITIHEKIDQGTPEWFDIRKGIPTASNFQCLMTTKGEGKGRKTYLYQLAAELIGKLPIESYKNQYMERGHEQEDKARRDLMFMADIDPDTVKQVGFVTNDTLCRGGLVGCSPDALVGEDEGIEIKTARADLLLEILDTRDDVWIPPEHIAQVQGNMWVTGRKAWHLGIYAPGMPLFKRTIRRDYSYCEALTRAVGEFYQELNELVRRRGI